MVEFLQGLKEIGFWWMLFFSIIGVSLFARLLKFMIIIIRGYHSTYTEEDEEDEIETYD